MNLSPRPVNGPFDCPLLGNGGVSRVQLVFTPPELRGHGFASACVAVVTARELAAGRTPMLYTDLANPTSNAIYQRIGYRWVTEAVSLYLTGVLSSM